MPSEDHEEESRLATKTMPSFEWDERKRKSNAEKHQIDFEDAVAVFSDPAALVVPSSRRRDEQRHLLVGELDGMLITVVYTLRGDSVRIISARRAHKSERKRYGQ
jgi:uncharacterized DUF497 family protein